MQITKKINSKARFKAAMILDYVAKTIEIEGKSCFRRI
jgi:hypothetical protein